MSPDVQYNELFRTRFMWTILGPYAVNASYPVSTVGW